MDLYDEAIKFAKDNEYIQDEALANELAAKFWMEKGKNKFAHLYMKEAHYCYKKWGALGKALQLESLYPWLKSTHQPRATTTADHLDTVSLTKAQRAISSEISLDSLSQTLLRIIMESAGAQTGFLFMEGAGRLRGELQSDNTCNQQIVFDDSPQAENTFEAIIFRK
jgi:GAF domain-containing protein